MPDSKIYSFEDKNYVIRSFVPKFIKNGYTNKVKDDALLAQDWFLAQMILEPKMTLEQIGEMDEKVVDGLFYKIVENTKFIDLDVAMDASLTDDEKMEKMQDLNQKRINDLKKKVSLR